MTRLVLTVALIVLSRPAWAEEPCRLGVGLYVPWTGPRDIEQRHALARELGARAGTRCPVRGVGYLRYGDFMRAVESGELDYAVVDAAAALASRRRFRVLGYWSSGQPWHIVARHDPGVLQGKSLAVPASDSPATTWLIERVLLRGQVRPKGYFSRLIDAPTTFDALAVVRFGKADLAFARGDQVGELRAVRDLGRWPEVALVATSAESVEEEAAVAAAVRGAVVARMGGSWTQDGRLRGEVGLSKPILAKPAPLSGDVWGLLAPLAPPREELPLVQLWMDAP